MSNENDSVLSETFRWKPAEFDDEAKKAFQRRMETTPSESGWLFLGDWGLYNVLRHRYPDAPPWNEVYDPEFGGAVLRWSGDDDNE